MQKATPKDGLPDESEEGPVSSLMRRNAFGRSSFSIPYSPLRRKKATPKDGLKCLFLLLCSGAPI